MAMQLDDRLADLGSWQPVECSLVRALEVVGTKAAMLIMREVFYGTRRFDLFARRMGMTDAVVAARLKELTAAGLLERVPYREAGQRTRFEYRPTEMGSDLFPVILGLMQWGDRYLAPDGGPLAVLDDAGEVVSVAVTASDGAPCSPTDLRLVPTGR
jgi:DNA-binding HxlR family transcriptional regulator